MSIQIYQDEKSLYGGRKTKREESKLKHIPKPNKRVALGNITNNVQGSRKQPTRAAKEKQKTCGIPSKVKESYQHGMNSENLEISKDPILKLESPMVLSMTPCKTSSFEEIEVEEIESTIKDIDKTTDIAYDVSEYANDIHKYLQRVEEKYSHKMNYMRKQSDININMRAILIDWLVEVAEEYKLQPKTLYLTVNYIDRFLSCMSVRRGKLQLVGTACMLVASKFEEIYPPEVSEFVFITDDTYTAKQVLRMESMILKTLSFELSVPTCHEFLNRYLHAAGASEESQLRFLARYLAELTLIDYDVNLKYTPSMIAASAVLVSNATLKYEIWSTTMQHYSGYDTSNLKQCCEDLHCLFKNAFKQQQKSVQTKYEGSRYGYVAKLSPPGHLTL